MTEPNSSAVRIVAFPMNRAEFPRAMTTALPAERAVGVAATEPRAKPPTAPTAVPIKNFVDPSPNENPPRIASNDHGNHTGFQFSIARIRARRSPSGESFGAAFGNVYLPRYDRHGKARPRFGGLPRNPRFSADVSFGCSPPAHRDGGWVPMNSALASDFGGMAPHAIRASSFGFQRTSSLTNCVCRPESHGRGDAPS